MVARQLCDGGADLIQLRAKSLPVADLRRIATTVLPVTRAAGVELVINDHFSLAWELGVSFAHLGQEDFFQAERTHVKELSDSPPDAVAHSAPLVGISTHAPTQARRAVEAGAAYLGVGPVYATGTKPSATPVGLGYVGWAAQNVAIPWFAIGGVTLDNLDAVLAAGARRVCVVSAILRAPDVAQACRQFKDRLGSAPH